MRIEKYTFKMGRDFAARMVCEHCGHEQVLKTGYDDANYHERVIPAMICNACHRNRAGDDLGLTERQAVDLALYAFGSEAHAVYLPDAHGLDERFAVRTVEGGAWHWAESWVMAFAAAGWALPVREKTEPVVSVDCVAGDHSACSGEESALWPDGDSTMRKCPCSCHAPTPAPAEPPAQRRVDNPFYLGDGVYATHLPATDQVMLTTGHHLPRQAQSTVYLEPEVILALLGWLEDSGKLAWKGRQA